MKNEEVLSIPKLSKKIRLLMGENKVYEALELCKKYDYNPNIQMQYANILFDFGRYEEAFDVCNLPQFKDNVFVKEQYILFLCRLGRFDEALSICESYKHDANIKAQQILILKRLGRPEEALDLCDLPQFKSNPFIKEQKIKVLMDLERYEEALKEASNPLFLKYRSIQNLKQTLEDMGVTINQILEKDEKLNIIYTKIYIDDISLDEIDNSDIDEFKKVILKVLYYEKNKISGALNLIKKSKEIYENDTQKVKVLNKLSDRFETKRMILLDYAIYSSILGCSLSDDLIILNRNKKAQEIKEQPIIIKEKEVVKTLEVKPKIKEVTKPVVIKRDLKVFENRVKKEKKVVDLSNLTIEDIFYKEIREIKVFLYVEMNKTQSKKIIDLYDRFCILIEKSIIVPNVLDRFIDFVIYINSINSYTKIDIDELNCKKLKYMKPSN